MLFLLHDIMTMLVTMRMIKPEAGKQVSKGSYLKSEIRSQEL